MSQDLVLSASSVTTFLRCGTQWHFAYVMGVQSPPNLKAVRGIAVHKAVEVDMTQKMTSGVDLPVADMLDAYADSWEEETMNGFMPDPGLTTGEIKDAGVKLVQIYHKQVAPTIQPIGVELPLQFDINGQTYCTTMDTPVLTQDLRWVAAGDLVAGDPVIGFDETYPAAGHRRRMAKAEITVATPMKAPVFGVNLRNGPTLRATGEHRWLVRNSTNDSRWMRTDTLAASMAHGLRKQPLTLPNFATHIPTTQRTGYDAGFLAAAFDGEGHLHWRDGVRAHMGGIGFTQKPNPMLDAVLRLLDEAGYTYRVEKVQSTGVCQVMLHGGRRIAEKFLAEYRPPRLLVRYATTLDRLRLTATEDFEIESVEALGEQEIATISSSSQTYLAAGFGAHNTGQIDLLEEVVTEDQPIRTVIRDTKTTGRRPSGSNYLLNMTGYALGVRQLTGIEEADTVLDYLVATQKPYYHEIRMGGPITDDDIRRFAVVVENVGDSIKAGRFIPNGLVSGACSWCGYKAICPAYKEA